MFCKSNDIDVEEYFKIENFYEENIDPTERPTQGDIIIPYQSLIDMEEYQGKNIIGVIVITNQCDIEQDYARFITFTPIYRTSDFLKFSSKKERNEFRRIISQNHRNFFYLPPHPSVDKDLGGVIYFENIRSERLDTFYKKNPKPTLRLKRPFIDRLCSKIAYFFNRIPIDHPNKEKLENWIDSHEIIKNIIEISRLQQNAGRYISSEDINEWIRDIKNLNECKELLNKYVIAQKSQKREDSNKLGEILKDIEKIENLNEKRFLKLKEDYTKLIEKKTTSR